MQTDGIFVRRFSSEVFHILLIDATRNVSRGIAIS